VNFKKNYFKKTCKANMLLIWYFALHFFPNFSGSIQIFYSIIFFIDVFHLIPSLTFDVLKNILLLDDVNLW